MGQEDGTFDSMFIVKPVTLFIDEEEQQYTCCVFLVNIIVCIAVSLCN